MQAWLRRRLLDPILALLRQGIAPQKLALSLALAVVIGLIPILGVSTALCAIVALAFGLNMPAMQLVNYVLSPLQLLLIIPFVRLGESLTGAPAFPITIASGLELLSQGVLPAIRVLWDAIVHAALAWILVAPPAALLLFVALRPLLIRYQHRDTAL
ncbi:MAG TPA: DUF2062 domain-containing protein [Steroidobacteraceae bacterium]|nr:DUF2062 domain-containing protein [Steroidobacteraceae bacterium]HRX89870.1 DUF2062 domain-containing protein [Steroidobacteraceae bacterium]